ncbi:MAG: TonB-dependent receptor [Bacteroidales bacterium]|nr:TonB-dependent receptor [Bacteroidales bacterium]
MLVAVFALTSSVALTAQTKIRGEYVDSLSSEPIPYATVAVYKGAADKPEQVFVTDLNGKFEATTHSNGQYKLSVTNLGYKPYTQQFDAKGQAVDFGAIKAAPNVENLSDVTVVAQKPIIKAEVDRITYNLDEDPETEAKTALEMLRKMPLITVDGEDNIKLNGNTNFKIHVNNRPSSMFDRNPGKILKGIPASAIKKVEIITDPGAKYDAEGIGGIINLIMTQGTTTDGYTATVSLYGELPTAVDAGLNLLVKKKRLTISSRGYYYQSKMKDMDVESLYETQPFDGSNQYHTATSMTQKDKSGMANVELSFEIDTMRLLTASYNYRNGLSTSNNRSHTEQHVNNAMTYSSTDYTESEDTWGGNELNLNYERKIGTKNTLTLSYKLYKTPENRTDRTNLFYDKVGIAPRNAIDNDAQDRQKSSEQAGQIDYVGNLNEHHTLELGAKYTARTNKSEGYNNYFYNGISSAVADSSLFTSFKNNQNVLGAYSSYTLRLSKFSAKLGLRYESTYIDVDNDDRYSAGANSASNPTKFDYSESDLVPSVFFSYSLAPTSTIKTSYNMRIMRPSIWYLNPHRIESTPFTAGYGNIDLESEHYHNFDISYSNFGQRASLNASVSYSYCNNQIVDYRFTKNGILESTYGNYGTVNNVGFNMYGMLTLSKSTRLNVGGNMRYTHISSSKVDEVAKGTTYYGYLSLQQTLPGKVEMSMYAGHQSKPVRLQGEGMSITFYDVSFTKSLMNDRLMLSLSSTNFFTPILDYKSVETTDVSRLTTTASYPMWNVRAGVSFRFGELKASVKHTRSIDNDDQMSGGGSSGISVSTKSSE